MTDGRKKCFDALDKISEMGEWYAKFAYDTRKYIVELEDYIKQADADSEEYYTKNNYGGSD
jgi:hypothetical protein